MSVLTVWPDLLPVIKANGDSLTPVNSKYKVSVCGFTVWHRRWRICSPHWIKMLINLRNIFILFSLMLFKQISWTEIRLFPLVLFLFCPLCSLFWSGHKIIEQFLNAEMVVKETVKINEITSVLAFKCDHVVFQLENGCLLSATNAAFIRTCLMPNGNGVTTGNIPVSCPDGLSALQDPHKSGFLLWTGDSRVSEEARTEEKIQKENGHVNASSFFFLI